MLQQQQKNPSPNLQLVYIGSHNSKDHTHPSSFEEHPKSVVWSISEADIQPFQPLFLSSGVQPPFHSRVRVPLASYPLNQNSAPSEEVGSQRTPSCPLRPPAPLPSFFSWLTSVPLLFICDKVRTRSYWKRSGSVRTSSFSSSSLDFSARSSSFRLVSSYDGVRMVAI